MEILNSNQCSLVWYSYISFTQNHFFLLAIEKCGITKDDLVGQPLFPEVIQKLFKWIKNIVKKANKKTSNNYFPGKSHLSSIEPTS